LSGIDKLALSRLQGGQQVNPTPNMLTSYAAALGKEVALAPPEVPVTGLRGQGCGTTITALSIRQTPTNLF
jgi:hypothetical protein